MSDEMPSADSLATKVFWITFVGAVLFCAAIFFFVL